MSVPKINGVQLSEPSAGPLLLLGNSIGTSATALWAASAAFLGERFHVVAWDLPGHGRNTDPVSDGFSMAELAAGVMAFAERVLTDRGESGGQLYYAETRSVVQSGSRHCWMRLIGSSPPCCCAPEPRSATPMAGGSGPHGFARPERPS